MTLDGWRTIDTAPQDGTAVLAYDAEGDNIFIAAWRAWYSPVLRANVTCWWSNGARTAYQPSTLRIRPTHWMPLPTNPPHGENEIHANDPKPLQR